MKTRRSIRCPARIGLLETGPNRFRAFSADGRQPFMPATISQCLPLSLIRTPHRPAIRQAADRVPKGYPAVQPSIRDFAATTPARQT